MFHRRLLASCFPAFGYWENPCQCRPSTYPSIELLEALRDFSFSATRVPVACGRKGPSRLLRSVTKLDVLQPSWSIGRALCGCVVCVCVCLCTNTEERSPGRQSSVILNFAVVSSVQLQLTPCWFFTNKANKQATNTTNRVVSKR